MQGKPVTRRLRDRTASLVGTHPVIVASLLRRRDRGGGDPELPRARGARRRRAAARSRRRHRGSWASWSRRTERRRSAVRCPPAPRWVRSAVCPGSRSGAPSLAQKFVLAGAPVLGAVLLYRAAVAPHRPPGRRRSSRRPRTCSRALMLWTFSEGRLDLLVALAVLPAAVERVEVGVRRGRARRRTMAVRRRRRRHPRGAGGLLPGGGARGGSSWSSSNCSSGRRGAGASSWSVPRRVVAAAILLFPFVPASGRRRRCGFTSFIGTTDLSALGSADPRRRPGDVGDLGLPADRRPDVVRAGGCRAPTARRSGRPLAAVAGLALVVARRRPAGCRRALSNPSAYLRAWPPVADGAVGRLRARIGLDRAGPRSVRSAAGRHGACWRSSSGAGSLFQCVAAMIGGWAVGGLDQIPAAWAVVDSAAKGDFRVLWVGGDDGQPFPAPGGDADGSWTPARRRCCYSMTDRAGVPRARHGPADGGSGRRPPPRRP